LLRSTSFAQRFEDRRHTPPPGSFDPLQAVRRGTESQGEPLDFLQSREHGHPQIQPHRLLSLPELERAGPPCRGFPYGEFTALGTIQHSFDGAGLALGDAQAKGRLIRLEPGRKGVPDEERERLTSLRDPPVTAGQGFGMLCRGGCGRLEGDPRGRGRYGEVQNGQHEDQQIDEQEQTPGLRNEQREQRRHEAEPQA
jgi:hypothetical protein